ncbi:hypothetical protein RSSM_06634 [Rhodopirellula sallentina SM41]|uniref:Uncharacterized protein n=1 Tax=Rhodopirellula sallentina SM41 TaxID=1263870 RepID=M5U7K7_9BACT|nr:hypothetical protein RSSM_06634 [Rhodopirellula sallentina SM41]
MPLKSDTLHIYCDVGTHHEYKWRIITFGEIASWSRTSLFC